MCGSTLCIQFWITFFTTLFMMSSAFFGGCVFSDQIKLALIIYVAVINVSTMIIFIVDKYIAVSNNKHQAIILFSDYRVFDLSSNEDKDYFGTTTRISELVLCYLVICGGVLGAWLGMLCCWHKIKKCPFMLKIGICTILNLCWPIIWLTATSNKNLTFCN